MHPRHSAATVGALLTALVVGGLVAVQSHANGQLAVEFGAGLLGATGAAVVSFGSGLLLLCLLCAALPRARRGLHRVVGAARSGRLRPWQLIGGMSGALLVVSQGFTVATIGVALFTVAVVAGQTSSALLADKVGAGPAGPAPITLGRGIGAALAVAAVALAVWGRLQGAAALAPAALALTALPLLAGAGAAWQQAVNGQVSVVGGPFAAAWLNFFVGATALTVLAAVGAGALAPGDIATPPPVLGPAWWLYAGGPIGVVFISAAAVLVRVLGVLVFGLCAISGQVITAVLVDLVLTDIGVGVLTLSGATLTLVGVGIATLSGRHARGTAM